MASSSSSPGPPLNTWVSGFAALRALELAGDVAGCLVLVALVVNRRRLTAAGAETAAFLALAVAIGVGVMLLASFYHPLEDGKYLSTAWAPLYPLLGAGLATLPWRRVAFGAAAVTTAVAAATVLAITNPETPLAVAAITRTPAAGRARDRVSERVSARPATTQTTTSPRRTRSVARSVPVVLGHGRLSAGRRAAHACPSRHPVRRRLVRVRARRSAASGSGRIHGLEHPLLDGRLCHDAEPFVVAVASGG